MPIRVPANIDTLVCELCSGGYHEDKIILCDKCDKGFHLFCLSPPLTEVPEGDWICPLCKKAESESFAFKPGFEMAFREFEKVNNNFKKSFFGGNDTKAKKVIMDSIAWCSFSSMLQPICMHLGEGWKLLLLLRLRLTGVCSILSCGCHTLRKAE